MAIRTTAGIRDAARDAAPANTAAEMPHGRTAPWIECIDFARLCALRGEWQRLLDADPNATPFQSPAWLIAWTRHYAPDRTAAIVVHSGDRVVALVPFFTWQKILLLAGTGPSD